MLPVRRQVHGKVPLLRVQKPGGHQPNLPADTAALRPREGDAAAIDAMEVDAGKRVLAPPESVTMDTMGPVGEGSYASADKSRDVRMGDWAGEEGEESELTLAAHTSLLDAASSGLMLSRPDRCTERPPSLELQTSLDDAKGCSQSQYAGVSVGCGLPTPDPTLAADTPEPLLDSRGFGPTPPNESPRERDSSASSSRLNPSPPALADKVADASAPMAVCV